MVRKWVTVLSAVTIKFVFAPAAQQSLVAFQLRETPLIDAEAVTWTLLQRIQFIVREKAALSLDKKGLEKHFSCLNMAVMSEKFSTSFIDAALTVDDRLLAIAAVKGVLEWWDQELGLAGPFNSVWKLEAVVHKAKTAAKIQWAIMSLSDQLQMQFITPGSVTKPKLRDLYVPVALLKLELKDYLLDEWLNQPRLKFSAAAKAIIRKKLATHDEVRKAVCPYPKAGSNELAGNMAVWAATADPSTVSLILFGKDLIYGDKFASALWNGAKNCKGADVVITYGDIKEDSLNTK